MVARIVDISVPLENGVPSDPPGYGFKISYVPHKETAHLWLSRYENLKSEDIGGEAFATEDIQLSTHNGTHVDAPWHYSSTMKNGMPTATIDEIPLEWFYGSGVKLDLKHLAHGTEATPRDIDDALFAANHTLKPNDIVLFNTAAGARYGFEDYTRSGCGFGRDATLHLTKQGIRVAGTDAWSWDPPFYAMQKKFFRDTRCKCNLVRTSRRQRNTILPY